MFSYKQLYAGLLCGHFQQAVKRVEEEEKELNVSLLDEALQKLASENRSMEEIEDEKLVAAICQQEHPLYKYSDDLIAMLDDKRS